MLTAMKQKILVFLFIGIAALWAILGCACWSGAFRHQLGLPSLTKTAGLPVIITTWPAHEVLLELSGHGFGANELSEFNITSLSVFFIYSLIVWSPLLLFLRKKTPVLLPLLSQAALLAVVSVSFWYLGNG